MASRFDPRAREYEERARPAGMIYVLMVVVAVAFGGAIWQFYTGPEMPRILAEPGPYKIEPPEGQGNAPDQVEQGAFYNSLEGGAAEAQATPRPGPEVVVEDSPLESAPPTPAPAPRFVANGPFVAQVAALQSEQAVDAAWRRLSSRAPDLFAHARLDVERADLGPRGVYHRLRAGYFADRANAARFCERVRQMGQDCIVSAR